VTVIKERDKFIIIVLDRKIRKDLKHLNNKINIHNLITEQRIQEYHNTIIFNHKKAFTMQILSLSFSLQK
jgi:hypothetical protein